VDITRVGQMVVDNRHVFLSKKCYHTFRGYAHSQKAKMGTKKENTQGKRKEVREKYGFDLKFCTHMIRLYLQLKQILQTQDLDLKENAILLTAIRGGAYDLEYLTNLSNNLETECDELYKTSSLVYNIQEEKITQLLIDCLEETYGNLKEVVGFVK
jgi:hypothetical protein